MVGVVPNTDSLEEVVIQAILQKGCRQVAAVIDDSMWTEDNFSTRLRPSIPGIAAPSIPGIASPERPLAHDHSCPARYMLYDVRYDACIPRRTPRWWIAIDSS